MYRSCEIPLKMFRCEPRIAFLKASLRGPKAGFPDGYEIVGGMAC